MPEQKEQTQEGQGSVEPVKGVKTMPNKYTVGIYDFGKIVVSHFPQYDRQIPKTGIAVLTYWGNADNGNDKPYERLIIDGEGRVLYAEVGKYDQSGVTSVQLLKHIPKNLGQRTDEVTELVSNLQAVSSEQSDAMNKQLEQMLKDGTINLKKEAA